MLHFLAAAVVSFIGSLQAGVVNTAVLAHTVKWGRAAGRRMALGGSVPEFIYAGAAFVGASWLQHALGIGSVGIELVVSVILLLLGLYFTFLFHPRQAMPGESKLTRDVRRGLLLGLANPQLLLFWCGVRLMFASMGLGGEGWADLLAFALGAFTGAIVLLLGLVRLGVQAQEGLTPRGLRRLFRAVGVLLLAAGGYGLLRALGRLP